MRRRVGGDRPVVGKKADGSRCDRPNKVGHGRRQGVHAHHAAALSARGFVMVQRQGIGIGCRSGNVVGGRRARQRGMVVRAAVLMDVLRDNPVFVHVHDAPAVFVLGQARRGSGAVREGERHRRRQNAEQVDQREQPPRRRSPGPGQSAQHRSFDFLAARRAEIRKPRRKPRPRQAGTTGKAGSSNIICQPFRRRP